MPYEEPSRVLAPQQQSASAYADPVSLDDALIARSSSASLPLGARAQSNPTADSAIAEPAPFVTPPADQGLGSKKPSGDLFERGSIVQTILALGGVLLLIFGLGQLYKRLAKSQGGLAGAIGAGGSAPSGLVEVLGRYPISSSMTLVVMRFDRRILLLSHAGRGRGKRASLGSMTPLCELDRPEDVASVLLKVRNEEGDSIAQSFARTLREADDVHDQYLDEPAYESTYERGDEYEQPQVRIPRSRRSAQVIQNDSGDIAEFGVQTESEAAAGVLRRRLASMRRNDSPLNQPGAFDSGTVR